MLPCDVRSGIHLDGHALSVDRLWWVSCTNQVGETLHMTNGASRLFAAGALAVAALAAPVAVALSSSSAEHSVAAPACLAWFGNKEDGNCMGRSNGQPITGGTPWGVWGPSAGISTGPLLPGQSWNTPLR